MGIAARRDDHLTHRQLMAAGEEKVPLVVGRHPHHGAGAVVGEHIIGDPEGHHLAVGRVAHRRPDRHTPLGSVFGGTFLLALAAHQIAEGLNGDGLLRRGESGHQGVLRCQHHIAHPEQRVGAGGEHGDRFAGGFAAPIDHRKIKLGTRGAADPVGLHGAHPLGPALQLGQIVEKLIGIGGDLQEPLPQLALLHQGAGAPGAALPIHLLVGQNRLVHRIPVHRGLAPVGQPRFQELQEEPLGPAVVVAVAGGHLPLPVDRQAELAQLLAHRGNVAVGPFTGFDTALNRGVLRRQAEGIPAHRVKNAMAAHAGVAGDHIGDHVVAHMPHVQGSRGIGEHREGKKGSCRAVFAFLRSAVQALLGPGPLPAALNQLGPVPARFGHGGKAGDGSRSCHRASAQQPQQHDHPAVHHQQGPVGLLLDGQKIGVLPADRALQALPPLEFEVHQRRVTD